MVQQIKIITRPSCEFDIPASEGYRLYSSLLSCMKDAGAPSTFIAGKLSDLDTSNYLKKVL
jgi:hypothetical protein